MAVPGGEAAGRAGSGAAGDLEAGLREALPGLVVLDRRLALGAPTAGAAGAGVAGAGAAGAGAAGADLVGVDRGGKLVLALRLADADGDGDGPVLTALDALAWARRNADLLARHLGDRRLRPQLPPLVVLVADRFDPRAVDRLAPLIPDAVRLLEVRELWSERAATTVLRTVGLPAEARAAGGTADPRSFLDVLDEDLRAVADLVVRRLERIDEDVRCAPDRTGLGWSFRGVPLCWLSEVGGHLEGSVFEEPEPMAFRSPAGIDAFVDAALARYVHLAGDDPGDPAAAAELGEVELVPHAPPSVLSRGEREALEG